MDDAEFAAELYAAADDLNDLLAEAAERGLHVPLIIQERTCSRGTYQTIGSPVYRKVKPAVVSDE